MLARFFVLVSLLFCGASHAAIETAASVYRFGSVDYSTAEAACGAWLAGNFRATTHSVSHWTATSGTIPTRIGQCYYVPNEGGTPQNLSGQSESCPAGYTNNNAAARCERTVASCTAPQVENPVTHICEDPPPNPCTDKAGDSATYNWTIGWQRSNNPDAWDFAVGPTWPPASGCDGECQIVRSPGSMTAAYVSQRPASNGLHRVSADMVTTWTGAQCTAQDEGLDPTESPPPCPGMLGQVNGQPVCIGTPAAPLPQSPRPPEAPPAAPGNPAAGPAPESGPGSGPGGTGRTPVSGDGGNAGGNGNAAIPGGGSDGNGQGTGTGSGNGTNPDGSPRGESPVPVDESGMPSGAGAYDAATAALNANRDAAVAGVNAAANAAGKSTGWTFFFAFPTGCSPIPLGGFDPYITGIDVCVWRDMVHDLMALVWLAATVFCCIGMVGRAVGGGSS